ncbi:MAG: hypothetical protein PHV82_05210 [Victivallaceae bacterium]|nr:hypothetical protein [Victivallaceae bacterium]
MKTSRGMSSVVENIMASYEARIKAVGELSRETAEMCRRFSQERKQKNIKGYLAKEAKTRLKEFDIMMSGINENIDRIRKEVVNLTGEAQSMIAGFNKERKNNNVRAKLAKGEKNRQQEYNGMMDGIRKDIEDIRKEVADLTGEAQAMLTAFGKAREDNSIRDKLAEGEKARRQEYSGMMDGIHEALAHIHKEVVDLTGKAQAMIGEFRLQKQQVGADWQTMRSTIAGKKNKPAPRTAKKTTAAQPTKAKPAPQPKSPEANVPQKKAKPAPQSKPPEASAPQKKASPKPEPPPQPAPPVSPEDAIIEYVAKHGVNGVRVAELEKPIGMSRLKLGKIAKGLLDQGKLRKEDNLYFPQ